MTERVALVTGAAGPVGFATALRLAREGSPVAVHFRSLGAGADRTMEILHQQKHGRFLPVEAELTEEDAVDRMFQQVEAELGPVAVLVNAVGPLVLRPWSELAWEDWEVMLRGNVQTADLCCRRGLPGMAERGWGRVVNLAFAGAERLGPKPTALPYAAAKTALLLLTRTLAARYAPRGVTVNAVSPGFVATPGQDPDPQAGWVDRIPLGRLAAPAEVAAAVAFLVGEESGYITGVNLPVAGGWGLG